MPFIAALHDELDAAAARSTLGERPGRWRPRDGAVVSAVAIIAALALVGSVIGVRMAGRGASARASSPLPSPGAAATHGRGGACPSCGGPAGLPVGDQLAFTTERPCRRKVNRPPSEAAKALAAELTGIAMQQTLPVAIDLSGYEELMRRVP